MKTKYKVLIALAIITVLGLIGFLVWWFKFRNKSNEYLHIRVKEYRPPVKEDVHKRITQELKTSTEQSIPKVVYLTSSYIDTINLSILDNIKKRFAGYRVEIHGDQSCEDFLYKFYGPDMVQLYRELGEHKRAVLWGTCILYVKGGTFIHGAYKLSVKSLDVNIWKTIIHSVVNITFILPPGDKVPEVLDRYPSYTLLLKGFHDPMKEIDTKKIDLPIIYINMDKAIFRRQLIEDQLKHIDSPVVRVPGVLVTEGPSREARGCFLAHLNAMQAMLNKGWDRCLILEDDASLLLSSRWERSLSELKYPCWLSQGCTAYIIDKWSAIDFIENNPVETRYSEGVDTIMCEMYGDNPMNDWTPYRKKGWDHYFYIYPMVHLSESQIQGLGIEQMESDSKRSVNIIERCEGGRRDIKIDATGLVKENKVLPNRQVIIPRSVRKKDIHMLRHRYPDTILEIYHNDDSYNNVIQQDDKIRLFDLARSNIESDTPPVQLSQYNDFMQRDFQKGVTTIITTAPQPSTPSPRLLVETVKTLSLIPLFNTSPLIIGFDGCKVNNDKLDPKCKSEFSCSKYDEYKENVKREVLKLFPHAVFAELPDRGCLSSLLHYCMQRVNTDYVNVMQQDLPISKKFDAKKVIDAMRGNSSMDLVRYVWKSNKHHEDYTLEVCSDVLKPRTITINGLKFTQCSQWSDNNHIAKMEHYIDIVWPNTKPYSFMEHQLQCYPIENQYYKIWYLGEPTDGEYIVHTDGRATVENYQPHKVTKQDNKYIKKYNSEKTYDIELKAYQMLQNTGIIPYITHETGNLTISLEDVGDPLSLQNIPKDYIEQVYNIINLLRKNNIAHNDLWSGNVMVKNGRIKIIDFEYATSLTEQPKFFRNDNLLDMTSVFFKKVNPLYLGTTETLSEVVSLCETRYPSVPGTTTLCSVIGGMSIFSLLCNPTINPRKIILYDIDPMQCMVVQVYLDIINQADTLGEFINLLYCSTNATGLNLDNMATGIRDLNGNNRPFFRTKSTRDFYYQKMLPRIMRNKHHEFPTELWPCWYHDANKRLVYPNTIKRDSKLASMYLRGDPMQSNKANTLYYKQGGWLLNNDKFRDTKHKLQNADIYIDTANLRDIGTLYEQFSLEDSDNLVFFVSNADQGEQWTDGKDSLKSMLEKVKNPVQHLVYVSANDHSILVPRNPP